MRRASGSTWRRLHRLLRSHRHPQHRRRVSSWWSRPTATCSRTPSIRRCRCAIRYSAMTCRLTGTFAATAIASTRPSRRAPSASPAAPCCSPSRRRRAAATRTRSFRSFCWKNVRCMWRLSFGDSNAYDGGGARQWSRETTRLERPITRGWVRGPHDGSGSAWQWSRRATSRVQARQGAERSRRPIGSAVKGDGCDHPDFVCGSCMFPQVFGYAAACPQCRAPASALVQVATGRRYKVTDTTLSRLVTQGGELAEPGDPDACHTCHKFGFLFVCDGDGCGHHRLRRDGQVEASCPCPSGRGPP